MKRILIFTIGVLALVLTGYTLSLHHAKEVEKAYLNGALAGEVSGMIFMAMLSDVARDQDVARTSKILDDILAKELESITWLLDRGAALHTGSNHLSTINACKGLQILNASRYGNTQPQYSPSAETVWRRLDCDAIRNRRTNSDA